MRSVHDRIRDPFESFAMELRQLVSEIPGVVRRGEEPPQARYLSLTAVVEWLGRIRSSTLTIPDAVMPRNRLRAPQVISPIPAAAAAVQPVSPPSVASSPSLAPSPQHKIGAIKRPTPPAASSRQEEALRDLVHKKEQAEIQLREALRRCEIERANCERMLATERSDAAQRQNQYLQQVEQLRLLHEQDNARLIEQQNKSQQELQSLRSETDARLARLQQLLHAEHQQLASAQEQAEKERMLAAENHAREAELLAAKSNCEERLRQLQSEVGTLTQQLETERLNNRESEVASLKTQLGHCQDRLNEAAPPAGNTECQNELQALRAQYYDVQRQAAAQNSQLSAQAQTLNQTLADTQQQYTQLQYRYQQLEQALAQKSAECAQSTAIIARLQKLQLDQENTLIRINTEAAEMLAAQKAEDEKQIDEIQARLTDSSVVLLALIIVALTPLKAQYNVLPKFMPVNVTCVPMGPNAGVNGNAFTANDDPLTKVPTPVVITIVPLVLLGCTVHTRKFDT